jgi:hypothetical protein
MFITLTHATGRILANIDQIIAIVEHNGKVYVGTRGQTEPAEVFETYDDIMARIEQSRTKVW